jgi:hypothetical protein
MLVAMMSILTAVMFSYVGSNWAPTRLGLHQGRTELDDC